MTPIAPQEPPSLMLPPFRRRHICTALGMLLAASCAPALAQTTSPAPGYPQRTIRLVVPFSLGGTTDLLARAIAPHLARELGQKIIIENKSGDTGVLGTLKVLDAVSDGYTLGIGSASTLTVHPAVNPGLAYHPVQDLTPIINLVEAPVILMAAPQLGINDHAALLARARSQTRPLTYASAGTGGLTYMLMGLYQGLTGSTIRHVEYRGAGPALRDVAQGKVALMIDNLPSALPYLNNRSLVPIAISSETRWPALPKVPTFSELGLPAMTRASLYGLIGPKGLPSDIVHTLNTAMQKVLQHPDMLQHITDMGATATSGTPQQFAARIQQDYQDWKALIARHSLVL